MEFRLCIQGFKDSFRSTERGWGVQLHNHFKSRTESLSELAGSIRYVLNKSYPDASMEIKEKLAKDMFIYIETLPCGDQVRRNRPKFLNDALSLSI